MDHLYAFTITGRCSICSKLEPAHPRVMSEPVGDCIVDHDSIEAKLLIGDDGLDWARCLHCSGRVEAKLATGQVDGPDWKPGRGALTPRQKERLVAWLGMLDYWGGER